MGFFDCDGGKDKEEQWKKKSSWGKLMDGYVDSQIKPFWDIEKMKDMNYAVGFWSGLDEMEKMEKDKEDKGGDDGWW